MRFDQYRIEAARPALSRSRQRIPGLTLVELLVAIAMLAFISMLGWRGLDAITRARAALNQELAQTRGLQLAFAQMEIDCANVVDANTLAGTAPLGRRHTGDERSDGNVRRPKHGIGWPAVSPDLRCLCR